MNHYPVDTGLKLNHIKHKISIGSLYCLSNWFTHLLAIMSDVQVKRSMFE